MKPGSGFPPALGQPFCSLSVLSLWWAVSTRNSSRHQVALEEFKDVVLDHLLHWKQNREEVGHELNGGCKGPGQPVPSPQGMSRALSPGAWMEGPIFLLKETRSLPENS